MIELLSVWSKRLLEFRKRRRVQIEIERKENCSARAANELELHQRWLDDYEKVFKVLKEEQCDVDREKHHPLSILCPVTWKTLEAVCRHNILTKFPS